jgi:FlaA1/EpsC-like NDP-sugar epimerase
MAATRSISQHAGEYLRGKRVLVTGACGTVGRQLVRQLVHDFQVRALTALDNNESALFFLEERFSAQQGARFILCDVRDMSALLRETRNIDVIFHAAAYKHVHLCERSPLEAVQTNILGVQNVVQAATENGVERLIFASSDKAVNPTNVMGTSKLMGERLITAAALHPDHSGGIFLSTRFGNVLGSRGSVIPVFRQQIQRGGPITVTDPLMTRFVMSLQQAVELVIESASIGQPGDVLITKMPAIRIGDLAEVMVRELGPRYKRRPEDVTIQLVGTRPGEKLYEELMNEEETRRSYEIEEFYVVRPAMGPQPGASPAYDGTASKRVDRAYNSRNAEPLSQAQLTVFLNENGLLDEASE